MLALFCKSLICWLTVSDYSLFDCQRLTWYHRRSRRWTRSRSTSYLDGTDVQSDSDCSRCRETCNAQEDYRAGTLFVWDPYQPRGACVAPVSLLTLHCITHRSHVSLALLLSSATRGQVYQERIGRYWIPRNGKADQGNECRNRKACVQGI
jgi:hypothetical protein